MTSTEPQGSPAPRNFYRRTSILLSVLSLTLVWQVLGPRWRKLIDPDAQPRAITPRGDLAADEKSTIELFKQASPAVTYITTVGVPSQGVFFDPSALPEGTGSGFIWDEDGHVVTNYHVIRDSLNADVTLSDQSNWPARRVGFSEDYDLAVLAIDAPRERLRAISIGRSDDLQVGQKVFAIGNPFGFDQTLTTGIISALGREISTPSGRPIPDAIQTDAPINPGNSGGPLLDSAGRLIGVNTAIASPTRSYAGVGFAIPIDTVNRIVPELIRHGSPTRPGIGVIIAPDAMTRQFGFRGVLVRYVLPGRTAAKAGIQQGDLILSIDGTPITRGEDLQKLLHDRKVGDSVSVHISRRGDKLDFNVRLEAIEGR